MTNTNTIDRLTGRYGPHVLLDTDPEWGDFYGPAAEGVLSDHLHRLDGVDTFVGEAGALYVTDGERVEPVLCSDIIGISTEDGPSDGRCGAPVVDVEIGACAGHADERRAWMAMDEFARLEWELAHDDF